MSVRPPAARRVLMFFGVEVPPSRLRLKWWSITNWLHGYAFGPVKRCRRCKHTLYPSQYHCPYCEAWAYCTNSVACAFPGCPCSRRFEMEDEMTDDRPHVQSKDCWCNPTVEVVEGQDVFLHDAGPAFGNPPVEDDRYKAALEEIAERVEWGQSSLSDEIHTIARTALGAS